MVCVVCLPWYIVSPAITLFASLACVDNWHMYGGNLCAHRPSGAVYYQGSLGANQEALWIDGSTFTDNNASSGGAISPWGVNSVQIINSTIDRNHAYYGRGGGLYTYGENSTGVESSTFC